MFKIGFQISRVNNSLPNTNYITMFKTIVTNTKNRRNTKYLFKDNDNKTPNAINYHGGLSSTLWTYLISQSLWHHDSEAYSMQLTHDKQKLFLMGSI